MKAHLSNKADRNSSLLSHPLVLPLYLPALLLSIAQGLIIPVLPLFAKDFGAPDIWVGLIVAGEGLGMLLSDLPNGIFMRKLDQKRAMIIGISIIGLSTLAIFWAPTVAVAFLLRILAGCGSSLYNVSRSSYLADTITIANRGRSVALLGGTFRAGRFLGPAIGGTIATWWGLRAPFLLYAIICLISIAALYIFNRSKLPPGIDGSKVQQAPLSFKSVLAVFKAQARNLTPPGIGYLLLQMVRAGPQLMIPLYGTEILGLDVQSIGLVMSISSMVDMTLFYPTGIVMDRMGRKFAIVPSAITMALGLAVIPLTHSMAGLILAAVLNGFGNGMGSGVMITLGTDLAPKEARGEFLGIWSLIGDAGATGGPIMVSSVGSMLGLQPAAWAIASVGLLSGLIFAFMVQETLEK